MTEIGKEQFALACQESESIANQNIIKVNEGSTFTPPKDGYFLSNMYMKKVMELKVEG
jgi:hypothetical protein